MNPHRSTKVALAALVMSALALTASWSASAAPTDGLIEMELAAAPIQDPESLGTWCRERQAAGTTGLSARAKAWLADCSAIWPASPTPTPTSSPSPSTTRTTSPPQSPTPTATSPSQPPSNGCVLDPVRCGFPGASNTGPTAPLTTINGNVTYSTAGQTIINTRINGCVEVRAANVTLRNVWVVGNGCFYAVRNFATGLVIEDSYIACGGRGTGVTATGYTVRRSEITGCENGFNVGGQVTVEDSWVHALDDSGDAHTDGAQFNQGAANITFRHNTIVVSAPGSTSAIIMWDEGGTQNSNVVISNNLLAGGTYTLYCPRQNSSNVRVIGNRFGNYQYGYANGCTPGHVAEWTNNRNDTNGALLGPA